MQAPDQFVRRIFLRCVENDGLQAAGAHHVIPALQRDPQHRDGLAGILRRKRLVFGFFDAVPVAQADRPGELPRALEGRRIFLEQRHVAVFAVRRYLADLRALPMPLLVRAVEVEPLDADGRARGGARSLADLFRDDEASSMGEDGNDTVPIIASNDAEFLVTVLYLDFHHVAKANGEDEEASQ